MVNKQKNGRMHCITNTRCVIGRGGAVDLHTYWTWSRCSYNRCHRHRCNYLLSTKISHTFRWLYARSWLQWL